MLFPLPEGFPPAFFASATDNVTDAYRCVAPHLKQHPGASVLIVGGMAQSIGLYAVALARSLGASRIDYADANTDQRSAAERLGARALEHPDGAYRITVDASGDPGGLRAALRATEPYGICTSIGIYFQPVEMALLRMYSKGITFITGRPNAGVDLPDVLDLMARHRASFEQIPTRLIRWQDACEGFFEPAAKLIVIRE
jgi:alcohol dehydrogenase